MSTRCTIHFHAGPAEHAGPVEAIIYRHSDGYPDGVRPDFQSFCEAVEADTKDTRYDDPCYLAAKFVVWQTQEYAVLKGRIHNEAKGVTIERYGPSLDFLGVGVMLTDPSDIEYRYHVWCSGKERPTLTHEEV